MSKKYNQLRNKRSREHGSEAMDLTDKLAVKKILENLGYVDIIFNSFLLRRGETEYTFATTVEEEHLQSGWTLARLPDVIFRMDYYSKYCIVEIDGDVHKDYDTDDVYDELGIKYVKLNKTYLKQENITWEQWIKEML